MITPDLHFISLGWEVLLLLIPVILWLFWSLFQYRKNIIESTGLNKLTLSRSSLFFWIQTSLWCLGWLFAVLALMGPVGYGNFINKKNNERPSEVIVKNKAHEIVFMLDFSTSMRVQDAPRKESRLTFAKDIIDQIMTRVRGETASLTLFGNSVTNVVPATLDYLYLRLILKEISFKENFGSSTNYQASLQYIKEHYIDHPTSDLKSVIFISDGGDPQSTKTEELLSLLNHSANANLRFYSIGIGTKEGGEIPGFIYQNHPIISKLSDELLKKMSAKGEGRYYAANRYTALILAEELLEHIQEDATAPFTEQSVKRNLIATENISFAPLFQVPLGLSLLCFAGAFLMPAVRRQHALQTFSS